MFDRVVSIIEREYFDVRFLKGTWTGIKENHESRYRESRSPGEREEVLRDLVAAVGVSHAVLTTPAMGAMIAEKTADPRRLKPLVEREGETLVLTIRSFKVPTTTQADLRAIGAELQRTRTLVLDLRLNDGGSGGVVVDLASMFLLPDTPVLRVRDRVGMALPDPHVVHSFPEAENRDHELELSILRSRHHVEYRTHEAAPARFEGPIVVLTGPTCYSSGEVFVQAMKEHTDATLLGRPTAGMVVAACDFPVGDGTSLLFPFAEMRSGKGVVIEGEGVTPHVEADLPPEDAGLLAFLEEEGLVGS